MAGFRPLSRYIGLYQKNYTCINNEFLQFPSPLEVYRFISVAFPLMLLLLFGFPSPLEVYRFISSNKAKDELDDIDTFPSPLEVYRFISIDKSYRTVARAAFPSPLEVYRFISSKDEIGIFFKQFPSPLEVYRFISPYLVL